MFSVSREDTYDIDISLAIAIGSPSSAAFTWHDENSCLKRH